MNIKKIFNSLAVLFLVIAVVNIINYTFRKSHSVSLNIESNTYETPANPAFTDENFYKCIVDKYNLDHYHDYVNVHYDEALTDSQLSSIEELYCINWDYSEEDNISNTKGIEKLTNLLKFTISRHLLEEIDVSKNTKLKFLDLSESSLTSIDVSKNINLETLTINNTNRSSISQITTLDVSKNTKLTTLDVSYNKLLSNLVLGNHPNLTTLKAPSAQLTSINLSGCPNLESLTLSYNKLTSIDLSNLSKLSYLNLKQNELTALDVSHNSALTELDLSDNNNLSSLVLGNHPDLKEISLSRGKLTTLNLSSVPNLEVLYLPINKIKNLDLNKLSKLTYLNLERNEIESLDISNNLELESLYVSTNKLKSLDTSHNSKLGGLHVGGSNAIESLDLSNNLALRAFSARLNRFKKDIAIYRGKSAVLVPSLVLPPGKNLTVVGYDSVEGISIDETNNTITSNVAGNYTLTANYTHDLISHNNEVTMTYDIYVIAATTTKYELNNQKGYIYTGTETNENTILSNIQLNYGEASIENNKYVIRYNGEVVQTFDIISISSTKHDLTKDYIYYNDYQDGDITVTNGTVNVTSDSVQIKYGNTILDTYVLVKAESSKYDLTKDTIKVLDDDIESFISNITCTNCTAKVYDGNEYKTSGEFAYNEVLRILNGDNVLGEYELTYKVASVALDRDSAQIGLDRKNTVKLTPTIYPENAENQNVSWSSSDESVAVVDSDGVVTSKGLGNAVITVTTEEGNYQDTCNIEVVDITTYRLTYNDGSNSYYEEYEENEEVTLKSDITKPGYTLIGWKDNTKTYLLNEKYIMGTEDAELEAVWELIIPKLETTSSYTVSGNTMFNLNLNTSISALSLGLDEIYNIKVYDNKSKLKEQGIYGTGDKLKIYLGDTYVTEYTVSVKGDLTGNGTVGIGDIAKLYQYYKGKITMEDCYIKAGNVKDTDNEIKISDVAKLYQYYKGKINSLE